jgi:hypothetical protein
MTSQEKDLLQTAILTICDPRGNWEYGWQMLCESAGMDPKQFQPPFRARSEEDIAQMAQPQNEPRPKLPQPGTGQKTGS